MQLYFASGRADVEHIGNSAVVNSSTTDHKTHWLDDNFIFSRPRVISERATTRRDLSVSVADFKSRPEKTDLKEEAGV